MKKADSKKELSNATSGDEATNINRLISLIQSVLTQDLLKKEYIKENRKNPLFGHCYVACEALYHIIKDPMFSDFLSPCDNNLLEYKPCRGRDENNITHWWLQNNKGKIIDPTQEQYTLYGKTPPYRNGTRGPFLTKKPSKRASVVIERVKQLVH